jgi:hypothetical protein
VPKVPVGGPPTTKPAKGAKPAPPPNPGPILAAVRTDLSQLTAIQAYRTARADVASSQQGVTAATAGVQTAFAGQAAAGAAERAATGRVGLASYRLRNMAIAAYMGLGYFTPAAGPQGLGPNGDGTVSTMGGLTGTQLADTQEMLRLVALHERHDVDQSRLLLRQTRQASADASRVATAARASLTRAQSGLARSRQTLALVTRAATNPASAAGLNLVALAGGPGASEYAGGSGAGGSAGTGTAGGAVSSPPVPTPPAAGLSALAATPTSSAAPAATAGRSAVDAATNPGATKSPTVLGRSVLDAAELARWFASTRHQANTTVPLGQLAADYIKAGQATGVRADIAFAQSVVETGFFSFPAYGQLTPKDNNFAGIGACDTCAHGWSFKNALTGVEAQLELLAAYASPKPVPTPLIGPVGIGGCCPTWIDLAGTWASSLTYGIAIMTVYHQMLSWLIPQSLVSAGLLAPPKPPATPASTPTTSGAPARHR